MSPAPNPAHHVSRWASPFGSKSLRSCVYWSDARKPAKQSSSSRSNSASRTTSCRPAWLDVSRVTRSDRSSELSSAIGPSEGSSSAAPAPRVPASPLLRAVSTAWARGVPMPEAECDSAEPALFAERALSDAAEPRRVRSLRGRGVCACQLGMRASKGG
eukprot:scaffold17457_cov105-Isochrysis_galbana.AAC.6